MGALLANPLLLPEFFDTLVAAGISLGPAPGSDVTGLFRLQDCDGRPFKWDQKDSPGTQGATITYRGWRPSKMKFRFELWTPDDIDNFFALYLPSFQIDATKAAPKPVDVLHPVLSSLEIYSVVAETIGPLKHEGKGLYSLTIEMLEYRQAKKKNVTTTPNTTSGTKPRQGVTTLETFDDKQDAEIAALMNKARGG